MSKKFNLRVYGILINERNELLVSDELIRGIQFSKFPGGGLEWGEGTIDCLKREFMEEMNQPIEVVEHFYTTDYFQQSVFREEDQLISIYYRVRMVGEQQFETKSRPFDFPDSMGNQMEVHRWVKLEDLKADDFRWPVDKVTVNRLIASHKFGK
ncbi:MAG: NUDIX domain-containing protein [Flavobacteriales bacterium]